MIAVKKIFLLNLLFAFAGSLNAQQNVWVQKAQMSGFARLGAVGFSIGTKGYIGTGYANPGNAVYDDLWEWDQATNVWTQKAGLISGGGLPRGWAVGFSIGTKGYIGTGYNLTYGGIDDLMEWDQATNTWTQKTNFPGGARSQAVGFSIGSKGYIGTGNYSNDFWEWNQASNTWTQKNAVGTFGRSGAVGFSIGTKGYIGTGATAASYEEDFWEWDQATDLWTRKADFGGGVRAGAAGFSIGGMGFIGTGNDLHDNYHRDLWEYNPNNDAWTQRANFGGNGRWVDIGFSIGTKGYIGTGFDVTYVSVKDLWEYTPSPSGIEDASASLSVTISVFPNPFTSSATFDLSKEFKNAQLKLFDVQGKEVRSINFSGKQIILEREKLESGIYFYQISSENKIVLSGKILAQ